jgi:tetratricopeptide (TPR) repeat protein
MQRVFLFALTVAVLATLAARADEPVIKQLYGAGAHAYFAKNYKEAHELLSTAAASKTDDPRVFYFRGLAQWQLGRPDEAKQDFEKGANLEATATDDLYSVDKALERIQGKPRLAIEDARLVAKNKAAKKRITEKEERYNRIRSNEPNILEGLTPPAKTPAPKKAEPAEPDDSAPKKADPPKEGAAKEGAAKEGAAKEGAAKEGAAKEGAAKEGTAEFDPLRENPLPVTPRKSVAGGPKPAAKTVEPAPAKEPESKPAEPKVAEKPMPKEDAPRPASPPGKKATTALARIIGKVAQQYVEDAAQAVPRLPLPSVGSPPAPPVPPKPKE